MSDRVTTNWNCERCERPRNGRGCATCERLEEAVDRLVEGVYQFTTLGTHGDDSQTIGDQELADLRLIAEAYIREKIGALQCE